MTPKTSLDKLKQEIAAFTPSKQAELRMKLERQDFDREAKDVEISGLGSVDHSSEMRFCGQYFPSMRIETFRVRLRKVALEVDGILSRQERMSLKLHVYESWSLQETARKLHVTPSSIRVYLNRAIGKLRAHFAEE